MSDQKDVISVLAPHATIKQVSRRAFLAGATATVAGGSLILTGCGEDEAPTTGGTASSSGPLEDQINMYTWGAYDYPKVMKQFTAEYGPALKLSSYDSNEQMISKLVATKGTSGFDIVVPTGVFIPQMVQAELLEATGSGSYPQFREHRGGVPRPAMGPGQRPLRPQGMGNDGLRVRQDQGRLARWRHGRTSSTPRQDEASGQTSMLADPNEVIGAYFWANDEDWNTTDTAALDACEDYLIDNIAAAHQGVRVLPRHQRHPAGVVLPLPGLERRRPARNLGCRQRQLGVGVPVTSK